MIIDRLYEIINNQQPNSKEYIMADYSLCQRREMKHISLIDAVNETGLSKSTIVRFVQFLGEANFTQFKLSYLENLEKKMLINNYNKMIQGESDDYLKKAKDYIERNWTNVINEFIHKTIKLIGARNKLYIFGSNLDLIHISYISSKFFELGVEIKFLKEETIGSSPENYFPINKDYVYIFIAINESISKFIDDAVYNKIYYSYINKILNNEDIPKIFMTLKSKEVYKGAYYFLGNSEYESLRVMTLILIFETIYVELQKRSS